MKHWDKIRYRSKKEGRYFIIVNPVYMSNFRLFEGILRRLREVRNDVG